MASTTKPLCISLYIRHLRGFLLLVSLLIPAFAQAQDAIGRVIRTTGTVLAVDSTGSARPLARGSEFFVDETITTNARGSVLLHLSDSSIVTLEANSQFVVNQYEFDGEGGAGDTVVMSMLRGGLRTISGSIGSDTGDTYVMNTPFANIGIRGTEYAVRVEANGRTYIFVLDGGITVTPASGGAPALLGLGGTSDAGDVPDALTVLALTDLPAELQTIINRTIETITREDLDALPQPGRAVEVQLQLRLDRLGEDNLALTANARVAGGALIDANGIVQRAGTQAEANAARAQVVQTLERVNPGIFDARTLQSASPH